MGVTPLKCKSGGYPKSGNSSEGEYPTGFSGETCDKYAKSHDDYMALTDLCFCGKKDKDKLTSHSNQTVIRYTGSNSNSFVEIEYYALYGEYKGDEYIQNFS
uniref:ApeC domain-containing protein n=1 Tax=Strongyloides venezuelensis TaxID=75913 RepID=A0A0K0FIE4_STRVS